MANFTLILDHIAKFEGSLGADPRDTCAKHPSSFLMPSGVYKGYPVHTNKGICYSTWVSASKVLGYDSSANGFINMTKTQWSEIIKRIFWDKLYLQYMNSQKIAELIMESVWGSGFEGSKSLIEYLQRLVNVNPDGSMGMVTVNALNSKTKINSVENDIYDKLWNFRLKFLQTLALSPKYSPYIKGWTNRMNDLYNRAKTMVASNPISVGIIIALGLASYSFYALKYGKV